jgi:hypothetical protein
MNKLQRLVSLGLFGAMISSATPVLAGMPGQGGAGHVLLKEGENGQIVLQYKPFMRRFKIYQSMGARNQGYLEFCGKRIVDYLQELNTAPDKIAIATLNLKGDTARFVINVDDAVLRAYLKMKCKHEL